MLCTDLEVMKMEKYKVGIIGATGMVGQRFVTLMENHQIGRAHV